MPCEDILTDRQGEFVMLGTSVGFMLVAPTVCGCIYIVTEGFGFVNVFFEKISKNFLWGLSFRFPKPV